MPEAWQFRRYQRQKLIEKLTQKIQGFQDKCGEFEFNVAIVAFISLHKIRIAQLKNEKEDLSEYKGTFFFNEIWKPIVEFSRTVSERNVLLCNFFEGVSGSALGMFHSEFIKEEVLNPKAVFGADTMEEIPFSNDD